MMSRAPLGISLLALAAMAAAAPLTPTITGHDLNFGAFNPGGPPEWSTLGAAPDILAYGPGGNEVTAYWPTWPTPPVHPVFDAAGLFGGDLVLQVMFTGQDAPYVGPGGTIDVSLTGTGAIAGGPDLMIFGAIPSAGYPAFGLLWAIDLDAVSLYGYSGSDSYVLEGVGTIVGGAIADRHQLNGQTGVMRGNLDFIDKPAGWIPSLYDPLADPAQFQIRAAYSGETGVGHAVPEPASMLALALGGIGLLARRRRR